MANIASVVRRKVANWTVIPCSKSGPLPPFPLTQGLGLEDNGLQTARPCSMPDRGSASSFYTAGGARRQHFASKPKPKPYALTQKRVIPH